MNGLNARQLAAGFGEIHKLRPGAWWQIPTFESLFASCCAASNSSIPELFFVLVKENELIVLAGVFDGTLKQPIMAGIHPRIVRPHDRMIFLLPFS